MAIDKKVCTVLGFWQGINATFGSIQATSSDGGTRPTTYVVKLARKDGVVLSFDTMSSTLGMLTPQGIVVKGGNVWVSVRP